MGYIPWGHKESDMTWQLNNNQHENVFSQRVLWVSRRQFLYEMYQTDSERGTSASSPAEDTETLQMPQFLLSGPHWKLFSFLGLCGPQAEDLWSIDLLTT